MKAFNDFLSTCPSIESKKGYQHDGYQKEPYNLPNKCDDPRGITQPRLEESAAANAMRRHQRRKCLKKMIEIGSFSVMVLAEVGLTGSSILKGRLIETSVNLCALKRLDINPPFHIEVRARRIM